jgi:hypothetical protein
MGSQHLLSRYSCEKELSVTKDLKIEASREGYKNKRGLPFVKSKITLNLSMVNKAEKNRLISGWIRGMKKASLRWPFYLEYYLLSCCFFSW